MVSPYLIYYFIVFFNGLNDFLIKQIIKRPRPFTEYLEFSKVCELADYSLPKGFSMASGHATVSMAFVASLFMHSKKIGLSILPYTLLVGVSRVALCVHYLSDVIAGWILGAVVAILVYFIINHFKKLYKKGDLHETVNFSDQK